VLAVPYELGSLDPHARNSLSDFALLSNLYEPLVTTDGSMRILPCLAERWENPDQSTWIFHLRKNVRFHSGKDLTSKDVVYTFSRLLSSQDLEMAGYLLEVAEVTATDGMTVKIRTRFPSSITLNKLRFILIVPANSGGVLSKQINGTGPYQLKSWKKDLIFLRNENYWGERPFLREVQFLLNRDSEAAANELLEGKAQFAQCNSKILKEKLSGNAEFEILQSDSMFVKYLGYDVARDRSPYCSVEPNPFKNKLVRSALQLAIDRKELVSKLTTYAVPANQPLPPFIFGYNPAIPDAPYDPQQARKLLQRAGLPNGFDVVLHVRKLFEQAGLLVRDQLAGVGIRVKVVSLEDTEILPGLRRHEYTFYLSRIGSPTGDSSDVTDNCLHSPDPRSHYGVMNYGYYSNSEVDQAIEESSRIPDIDKRRNLVQSIMSKVMDDIAWIPLYIDQDVYAIHKAYSWKPRNDSFILAAEIKPAERLQ